MPSGNAPRLHVSSRLEGEFLLLAALYPAAKNRLFCPFGSRSALAGLRRFAFLSGGFG